MISDQEAGCWPLEIGCGKALQGGTNGGLSTGDCSLWKQADLNSPTRDVTASCSLVWPLPVFGYVAEHNEKKCESKCNPGWQDSLYLFACMCVCFCRTYYSLPSMLAQPHELLVLPWDEVDCCVLQQCSKHKQQTNGHPDVNGLHVGHLGITRSNQYI